MSDANRQQMVYLAETAFATEPTGTAKVVPIVDHGLKLSSGHVSAKTLRADRQIVDRKRTRLEEAGPVSIELQYAAFDDWWQYLLQSAGWSTVETNTGNYTISGTTWSGTGIHVGLVANQWCRFKDGSTVVGYAKIVTVGTDTMTVDRAIGNITGSADEEVEMGGQVVQGTTLTTVYGETEKQDLSNEFVLYKGLAIAQSQMEVTPENIVAGSFGWLGATEASATATFSDGAPTAAPTNPIMNAIDNVTAILGGVTLLDCTRFSWDVKNALRLRRVIATAIAKSMGTGTIDAQGGLELFFDSKTLMDQYRNQTKSSLAIQFQDDDGNAYIFDWPRVKFADGEEPNEGQDTDILAKLTWAAYRHETEDVTMRIARWAA